jgi:hypothetical protein
MVSCLIQYQGEEVMAKFVISYDNLTQPKESGGVREQHDIIDAPDKEQAEVILKDLKRKDKIDIKITKNNIYKGAKKALNEGKR